MKFSAQMLRKNDSIDTFVIPVFSNGAEKLPQIETLEIPNLLDLVEEEEFPQKLGETFGIRLGKTNYPKNIVLVALGDKSGLDSSALRKVGSQIFAEVSRLKGKNIGLVIADTNLSVSQQTSILTETFCLAEYKFDQYLSNQKELPELSIAFLVDNQAQAEVGIAEGEVLGKATNLARQLVNEPANVLTPEKLGNEAIQAGEAYGFQVEVYEETKIDALGMKAFMEVARAAANRPRLIVMRYFGNPTNKKQILGLVGKGLTYDSGGLSIKPNDGMVTMKCDMGGAAAVVGGISAIARQKLPINVVGVIAACENMINGTSYHPGDIIETMAGKTVYIASTDAEGRLTLADAVHYVIEHEGADKVVDVATLTGAAIVALGHVSSAVVTNDQEFYKTLEAASMDSGDRVWQLPAFEEYKELNKCKIADLTNVGGRAAGTITAGLFVGEFVQNKPWLHIDIAGTAFTDKPENNLAPGGTGAGVRALYHLAKTLA